MARSSARESIGSSIGAYTITRAIGAGGMGVVYLGAATDPRGGRFDVAIKELGPHLFGDPTERARFLRETRVSGLIRHPNVVRTLDVVEANGSVYHVMEFVDGMSLHELLGAARAQGRPLPADVVVRIVVDVLAGLAGAYRSQSENGEPLKVVHRDVSPQNILIGNDGRVLLADFGIAKTATHHTKDADHGFRGKVRYVAPEQIKNEPVAHGTDIYSACVCAWEAFAGRPLFEGDTLAITVARVLAGNIPSLRDFNPQIPEALDGLIRRGLSAELSSRPLDAEAFSRALASTLAPASRESLADVVRAFRRAPRIADASGPPGATVTVSVVRTVGSISEGGLVAVPPPDTFAPEPEPRRRFPWTGVIGFVLGALLFATVVAVQAGRKREPPWRPDGPELPAASEVPTTSPPLPGSVPLPDATVAPVVSTFPVVDASAPAAAAATPPKSLAKPVPPLPKKPDCRVPTFIDDRGVQRIKKECL